MSRFAAAGLIAGSAGIAGCSQGNTGGDVISRINHSPGAQMYTGQGEMGNGVAGNSSGFGGPSQVVVPPVGGNRDPNRP